MRRQRPSQELRREGGVLLADDDAHEINMPRGVVHRIQVGAQFREGFIQAALGQERTAKIVPRGMAGRGERERAPIGHFSFRLLPAGGVSAAKIVMSSALLGTRSGISNIVRQRLVMAPLASQELRHLATDCRGGAVSRQQRRT
jgi:hypothetical protein